MQKVTFKRDELTLVGLLFLPKDFDDTKKYNAIIVQGSATSVKEQMSTLYGQRFADEGFVALGFDYAYYGESDGEPRQLEDYREKLKDLEAAVSYLSALPYVKGVAMAGICTSGGNMPYLAAHDKRLKAAASIAGYFITPAYNKQTFGEEIYNARLAQGAKATEKWEKNGEMTILTAYSEDDPNAVNYLPIQGAFDYYLNPKRGGVKEYHNGMNVMSYGPFYNGMDSLSQAKDITIPVIVVESDGCAAPEQAKAFFEALKGEKKYAGDGGGLHFDYYDTPAQVDYAVAQVSDFFRLHMG